MSRDDDDNDDIPHKDKNHPTCLTTPLLLRSHNNGPSVRDDSFAMPQDGTTQPPAAAAQPAAAAPQLSSLPSLPSLNGIMVRRAPPPESETVQPPSVPPAAEEEDYGNVINPNHDPGIPRLEEGTTDNGVSSSREDHRRSCHDHHNDHDTDHRHPPSITSCGKRMWTGCGRLCLGVLYLSLSGTMGLWFLGAAGPGSNHRNHHHDGPGVCTEPTLCVFFLSWSAMALYLGTAGIQMMFCCGCGCGCGCQKRRRRQCPSESRLPTTTTTSTSTTVPQNNNHKSSVRFVRSLLPLAIFILYVLFAYLYLDIRNHFLYPDSNKNDNDDKNHHYNGNGSNNHDDDDWADRYDDDSWNQQQQHRLLFQ